MFSALCSSTNLHPLCSLFVCFINSCIHWAAHNRKLKDLFATVNLCVGRSGLACWAKGSARDTKFRIPHFLLRCPEGLFSFLCLLLPDCNEGDRSSGLRFLSSEERSKDPASQICPCSSAEDRAFWEARLRRILTTGNVVSSSSWQIRGGRWCLGG